MKYSRFIIVGLAFVFLIYVIFVIYQNTAKNNKQNEPVTANQEQTSSEQWETKTDEQLPVTINVTPTEFGKDANLWKFDIVLDTHSGSLDQDIVQIATLVDDKGNIYKPTSWDGAPPGGHHREGILTFNSIQPAPEHIELIIKDVGGIKERSFRWNITK